MNSSWVLILCLTYLWQVECAKYQQSRSPLTVASSGDLYSFEIKKSTTVLRLCEVDDDQYDELDSEYLDPPLDYLIDSIVQKFELLFLWARPIKQNSKLDGSIKNNSSVSLGDVIIQDQNGIIRLRNIKMSHFPDQDMRSSVVQMDPCLRAFKTIYEANSNITTISGKISFNTQCTDFTLHYHNLKRRLLQIKSIKEETTIFTESSTEELKFTNATLQLSNRINNSPNFKTLSTSLFNEILQNNDAVSTMQINILQDKEIAQTYRRNILRQISGSLRKFMEMQSSDSYKIPSQYLANSELEQFEITGITRSDSSQSKMKTTTTRRDYLVKVSFSFGFTNSNASLIAKERGQVELKRSELKKFDFFLQFITSLDNGEKAYCHLESVGVEVEEKHLSEWFQKRKAEVNSVLSTILEENVLKWLLYTLNHGLVQST